MGTTELILVIIFSIIGCLGLLLLIFTIVISYVFFKIGFKRKNVNEYTSIIYDAPKEIYHWYERCSSFDVTINTFDGIKLTAKYVKNPNFNHLYFLTIHGYHGMFISRMPIAKVVFDKYNANVLAINQRGHYTSEGKYNSLGYLESKDLQYWINYIIENDKDARIILDGVSMGATTIMYRLNEISSSHVLGAICDCGFYSFYDEILKDYKKFNNVLFPFSKAFLKIFYKIRYKVDLGSLNCFKGLSESQIQILLIHAKDDPVVPYSDHEKECEVFNKNTKINILHFEDGGHARTFYRHNDEYVASLTKFINEIIK